MRACVLGVGLLGSGLDGWEASQPILRGAAPWIGAPVVLPPANILPATERRRASAATRLALAVAAQAATASGLNPASLRCVFASSNGDGQTVGAALDALSRPDGFVSPTLFHNSVHNAAAGYWSIATGSRQPATCLGCHDATFGAALLKAVVESCVEREAVLLVVYDAPFPAPLDAVRPTGAAFGMALVLTPGPSRLTEEGGLAVEWHSGLATATPSRLDTLTVNPAARSLALLELLARGGPGEVTIPLLDGHLRVRM